LALGSARVHAGIEPAPIPLNSDPLRAALGDSPHWRERYRELIQAPTGETRKSQVHLPPPHRYLRLRLRQPLP
jgi:hypothetical protein